MEEEPDVRPSDPDTSGRVSHQQTPDNSPPQSPVSEMSLEWDNLSPPTEYQQEAVGGPAVVPAGLLDFDPVFWGEDEATTMYSWEVKKRKMSKRERRRRKSAARNKSQ